jgi:calcineurin-like phosphoesterase family protein
MTILFTSDSHFGHTNIIRYCGRPFETKEEHDETLIKNWNSVVTKKDIVYHLGDFGFGSPEYLHKGIAQRLNGKIHLIIGNHDAPTRMDPLKSRFVFQKDVHFMKVKHNNKKIELFLSHYPHRSWPKSFHGSYHLFGHVHGKLPPHGLSFDVGVDACNFTPMSLEEVDAKMEILRENFDPEKIR